MKPIGNPNERIVTSYLEKAGITVNGDNDYDPQVHDQKFYQRVMAQGSLGLGESYMEGQWDCAKLDEFFSRLLAANLDEKIADASMMVKLQYGYTALLAKLLNRQNRKGAMNVIDAHYNLPVELYENFLDPYNQYTCGYFKDTENLNAAQLQKMDLIAKKLRVGPGDELLDIGCGWGGFSKFVAEHYRCNVTGISISKEQITYAKEFTKGLPVEIIHCDYRDLYKRFGPEGANKQFDKVSIIGMSEHVGPKNYRTLASQAHSVMKEGGLLMRHTIGGNKSVTTTDPWIDKYIFPGGVIPSLEQLEKATRGLFTQQHFENFGHYYDKTLMAWYSNFEKNIDAIQALGSEFNETFKRMWRYYLLSCAGTFRAGKNHLWQTVYSKGDLKDGYQGVVNLNVG